MWISGLQIYCGSALSASNETSSFNRQKPESRSANFHHSDKLDASDLMKKRGVAVSGI